MIADGSKTSATNKTPKDTSSFFITISSKTCELLK
jgi:hypothetical protein